MVSTRRMDRETCNVRYSPQHDCTRPSNINPYTTLCILLSVMIFPLCSRGVVSDLPERRENELILFSTTQLFMLPRLARTALVHRLITSPLVIRGTSTRHCTTMTEPDPSPEQVVAQLKQVQSEIEALRVKHNLTTLVRVESCTDN